MMKLAGIKFAPLWLPLKRRLQTAAVFYYCCSFLLFHIISITVCVFLLFTPFFFLPVLYIAWIYYDQNICNKGGRQYGKFRNWRLWKYFQEYFPATLIKTADLDPSKNYIFCYHPHGIMCFGLATCLATEAADFKQLFPGIRPRVLTLKMQFMVPFSREYVLYAGACAVTKESIEWLLSKEGTGHALMLVVGGASEALYAHPGTATLVLKKRKGFVKLALKHGASLVPVFAFGENELYNQVSNPEGSWLRIFQNKFKDIFGFAVPIICGRGLFQYTLGFLPHRKPITVVVGKPLDFEKIPEPTEDEVNQAHRLYINSLIELFEQYKPEYGPNIELKII